MARIDLIASKEGLTSEQAGLYDWIVDSRGTLVRPFQVLLHMPRQAEHIARLGHVVRYESGLDGATRELAILATGQAHGCDYVWETHVDIARAEGVRSAAIRYLMGEDTDLNIREAVVVELVRELCSLSFVADATYTRATDELGVDLVLELSILVGYYTMLSYSMGTVAACRDTSRPVTGGP